MILTVTLTIGSEIVRFSPNIRQLILKDLKIKHLKRLFQTELFGLNSFDNTFRNFVTV